MKPNDADLTTKEWIVGIIVVLCILAIIVLYYVYVVGFVKCLIIEMPLWQQDGIIFVLEQLPFLVIVLLLISQPMWLTGRRI